MKEPKTFEEAMGRLEKIVAELEEGGLSLEASMQKYQEGMELTRYCGGKLQEAEQKIKLLVETKDGFELKDSDI